MKKLILGLLSGLLVWNLLLTYQLNRLSNADSEGNVVVHNKVDTNDISSVVSQVRTNVVSIASADDIYSGVIIEKEEDGVWNVSGPRLERVFDINKLNTEEDFYLFANKMRYLGIDTALREAGCQDGDTVRLLGFEFEFIEN